MNFIDFICILFLSVLFLKSLFKNVLTAMKKVICLLFLSLTASSFAAVPALERDVLLELYHSTNGYHWKNKWNLAAPVATWYGVTVLEDKVVGLDLSDNNLSGALPESIGNLSSLKKINFCNNRIEGAIPKTIGNLTALAHLNLSHNQLSGVIPSSIGTAIISL